jgi:hypothetical protein
MTKYIIRVDESQMPHIIDVILMTALTTNNACSTFSLYFMNSIFNSLKLIPCIQSDIKFAQV